MAPKAPSRRLVNAQEILTSICTKWGLLILYELSRGARRHGELRRAIGGVSQKMLTQTLRTLERDRLVRRTIYPIVPPRVDYALTPLGKTLMQPLSALYRWTERHLNKIQQARRESQKTQRVVVEPDRSA
jgi:DNA-binding HxlR family transcriptional regulator